MWDPRTGSKTMKLKGHTDNIRALLLDSTGRYAGKNDALKIFLARIAIVIQLEAFGFNYDA